MNSALTRSVLADLNTAIKKFGSYNLHDKGAREVMDVDDIETVLRAAGPEEATETLVALANDTDGKVLLDALLLDFVENDEWPELTDYLVESGHAETLAPWLAGPPKAPVAYRLFRVGPCYGKDVYVIGGDADRARSWAGSQEGMHPQRPPKNAIDVTDETLADVSRAGNLSSLLAASVLSCARLRDDIQSEPTWELC